MKQLSQQVRPGDVIVLTNSCRAWDDLKVVETGTIVSMHGLARSVNDVVIVIAVVPRSGQYHDMQACLIMHERRLLWTWAESQLFHVRAGDGHCVLTT